MGSALENVLNEVAKAADENAARQEGDYIGADGLLYCGKCNTPKQTKIRFLGNEETVGVMCSCQKSAEEAIKSAKLQQQYRADCFSSPEDYKKTLENDKGYHPEVKKRVEKYIANFETLKKSGFGMLLHGPVGTGKSFHACQIANGLIDRGKRVKFSLFEDLHRNMPEKSSTKKDFLQELISYDLVVLDDLGAETKSAIMQTFIFTVIDNLYRAKTPFIITTNLTLQEMMSPNDKENERIYSRIIERCPGPILVEGNIRTIIAKESAAEYKQLLGMK